MVSSFSETTKHLPALHEPGYYRVRVAGRLGPEWRERWEGVTVDARPGPVGEGWTSELQGQLADHSALMGVLDQLALVGARLLEVECLGTDAPAGGAGSETKKL